MQSVSFLAGSLLATRDLLETAPFVSVQPKLGLKQVRGLSHWFFETATNEKSPLAKF